MHEIIKQTRRELLAAVDVKTQESSQRYFKETINSYGVKIPTVHKISKVLLHEMKNLDKKEVFSLAEELWQSGNLEESIVACNWCYSFAKQFEPVDFEVFKNWIDSYINNWASCDTFCNHTMGDFVMMYPEYIEKLKQFTQSNNRWMKRAAAVSLIIPARKGLFLEHIYDVADALMHDPDDLVQKGYGWMLKVASQTYQVEIFHYVMQNKQTMPRTALRYAIEKMPKELRVEAMRK